MNSHTPPFLAEALNGSFRRPAPIDADPSPLSAGRDLRESSNDAKLAPEKVRLSDAAAFMSSLAQQALRPAHIITRESNGCGLDGWSRMVCTCQWAGPQRYESDDFMSAKLMQDKVDHLDSIAMDRPDSARACAQRAVSREIRS